MNNTNDIDNNNDTNNDNYTYELIHTYELYPLVEIPKYDVVHNFVISAESEKQARKMAQKKAGDEAYVHKKDGSLKKISFWTNPKKTGCELLKSNSIRIVSRSFNAG
jgi:hypothetical protein